MSENEGGVAAVQEQAEFVYPITVEDVGPATRKVSVEIPADRIADKLAEQFTELRQQAAIPGFRVGHAPRKLIEKRFEKDVRDQVRRALISESYEQAIEKNALNVIGDPQFDDLENQELPREGAFTYSFQVEVQPEIQLPSLENLRVKKPRVQVGDDEVNRAMQNLREQQGTLLPVEDRGAQEKDFITANVRVLHDGNEVAHQHDAQLVARPGRIAGIQVDDLAQQLQDVKPGETRTLNVKAPSTHANEALRDKDVQIEIAVKDIKRLEPAELNDEFLQSLGFDTEQEVRDEMKKELEARIEQDAQQAMRQQVNNYLLENVQVELPAKLSDNQAARVVDRRALDLMMRGMPREQVEQNLEQLKSGAHEEAARELKLFFILQKVAQEQGVDVDEAELNGQIAMLATQRERRPEKLKQEMAADGSLANLYLQLRERKAIDRILQQATIEEVDLKELSQQQSAQQGDQPQA